MFPARRAKGPPERYAPMHLLLSSVFGPFGVDDPFGSRYNKMELFHNQVTREQGLFSFRFNHPTFGLHFLAENVQVPTTVLDFPTWERFDAELRSGRYTHVGISFIVPNFEKAKVMAELVRQIDPDIRIILGGHGTSVPEARTQIPHDHLCVGEGVRFLRRIFGENEERAIVHPLVHSSFNKNVMGVKLPDESGVLVPGVGCANRCKFCATSHFFGQYTPYLATGKEVFDVCCRYEDELGITDFGVLDENFLKVPERALELVALMERHQRFFNFAIFSSAETLRSLPGLDFLVRMGVTFIWMGVESKKACYEKNAGVDFHDLVAQLRGRGISVMTSVILFEEHHDHETIFEDIDFGVGLKSDYVQFMQLGPMNGTALFEDYAHRGKLLPEIPYRERHGQEKIWFTHPSFTREESFTFLKAAFAKDYRENGPSFLRLMDTALRGLVYTRGHADPFVRRRAADHKKQAGLMRHFLAAARGASENEATSRLVDDLRTRFELLLGPPSLKERMINGAVAALAHSRGLRNALLSDVRQPPIRVHRYRVAPAISSVLRPLPRPRVPALDAT